MRKITDSIEHATESLPDASHIGTDRPFDTRIDDLVHAALARIYGRLQSISKAIGFIEDKEKLLKTFRKHAGAANDLLAPVANRDLKVAITAELLITASEHLKMAAAACKPLAEHREEPGIKFAAIFIWASNRELKELCRLVAKIEDLVENPIC